MLVLYRFKGQSMLPLSQDIMAMDLPRNERKNLKMLYILYKGWEVGKN
jgi:hypothetical protein